MEAILRRLQSCGITLPEPCAEGTQVWSFSQSLQKMDIEAFRYFVKNHQLITIEYRVYCAQLARDLLEKTSSEKQLETALMMAELLEHLHRYYLDVPREVERYRHEQDVYRTMLAASRYQFSEPEQQDNLGHSPSRIIRDISITANLTRNFIARTRRLFLAIVPLVNDLEGYGKVVGELDKYASPILAYVSWIFWTPRALINLFLTAKHLFPGAWMSEQEKALGWQTRLKGQMERRWFELANDLAWIGLGLSTCFALTGSLAPVGFYLNTVLLAYDVIIASIRAYVEIHRLRKLEEQYIKVLADETLTPAERQRTLKYIDHLHERMHSEKQRLLIQVVHTSVLLLAFFLAFPLFAFSPAVAVAGAVLALLMTIATYSATKWVEKHRPVDTVPEPAKKEPSVVPFSMFKSKPSEAKTEPCLEETMQVACAQ